MAGRSKVQNICQQARLTFSKKKGQSLEKGFSEDLEKLLKLVQSLTAADFNLTTEVTQKQWDYKPYVTNSPAACMEVFECSDFSIGLFLIKPQMSIPLHDHPGMHGIMKVLLGSMTVTSYTGRPHNGLSATHPFSASLMSKTTFTPQSQPCTLEPQRGNIHEIVASEKSVVFLDILAPPYNPKLGRDCTYYNREKTTNDLTEENSVLLKSGPNPSWFSCIPLPYSGPQVTEST